MSLGVHHESANARNLKAKAKRIKKEGADMLPFSFLHVSFCNKYKAKSFFNICIHLITLNVKEQNFKSIILKIHQK
jgi:hypothetical protein